MQLPGRSKESHGGYRHWGASGTGKLDDFGA